MNPTETYLRDVQSIIASGEGVPETSYYPALSALLNAVGAALKPKVRCVINPRNIGAGIPDGGLFTPDQFQRHGDAPNITTQVPARGAIEAKKLSDDLIATANSDQVDRYVERYGQVLVTNFRSFVLVGRDAEDNIKALESYTFAPDAESFRRATLNPKTIAAEQGQRFEEYLTRVMLHPAPLVAPKDVASLLASYAREALARIEHADLDALAAVRSALEEVLGLKFEGEKGDHFFRSSLVQTLFYGVFSAWVLWSKKPRRKNDRFRWHDTAWSLHVPMIRALFEQIATPAHLGELGVVEMLDWAEDALNRVDRAEFFKRFDEGQAVQYFYEPFLHAFDPELRRQLGVWFTPPEIVQYMVARVDTVLREELQIEDGLADDRVIVLDPCTGTGSYLVEVLRHIAATVTQRSGAALAAHAVKRAAMERVYGFEILPAPFVVAHLQLGLLLQKLGAPLSEELNERAAVYLTNALTGWESPDGPQQHLAFPEMEEERDAAGHVKRERKIIVVLGNPPYSGFAGVAVKEERGLTAAYKKATRTRQPQGQGLNDLYVRFFRMAERGIVEKSGLGVVCFISNYSWLDGLSFTAMRERYLDVFGHVWIDCLNGDKYKTGKLTPEGDPDPSIFSTEWNREGIQVGTAIALMVRDEQHQSIESVHFRNLWGTEKRSDLLASLDRKDASYTGLYEKVTPGSDLGFPFTPAATAAGYAQWPTLPDLFPVSYPGVKTSRDDFLVDVDRDRLEARLRQYFDPAVSHAEMRRIAPAIMEDTARFKAEDVRKTLRRRGFLLENIVRYCYRPFDVRWLYWEPATELLDRKREDYYPQVFKGNVWIEARQKQPMERFDRGFVTTVLADNLGNGLSSFFPAYTRLAESQPSLFESHKEGSTRPNVSDAAAVYLQEHSTDGDSLHFHCAAILRTPAYATENAGALRQDWPHIPLPADDRALATSASLGREVAALLDTEESKSGVTSGGIREELRLIGTPVASPPGQLDLAVTAGWGHAGQGGVTMPGRGKVIERGYTPEETAAIEKGAAALGLSRDLALAHLGATTRDIYLNDTTYWRNVPAGVWEYTIGGYQVLKKWLSYREQSLLGRPITAAEAAEAMNIARRIAALLLLEPALDDNYRAVTASTYRWPAPQR